MVLRVVLAKGDGGWRVHELEPQSALRARLALVGPDGLADAPSASVEIPVEASGPVADAPLGALLDRLAAGIPEPSLGDGAPALFEADRQAPAGPRDPLDARFQSA